VRIFQVVLAFTIMLGAALSPADLAATTTDLVPGKSGVVRTVLKGRTIEEIPLTFLGTYENVLGPGFDLHLVQLQGPVAESVGVANGMSGSPVYIDGELIGALAYRFGFMPRVPVAGVTPLEQILDASRLGPPAVQEENAVASPIGTPIQMGGMSGLVREWVEPQLRELGFIPVAGGASGETSAAPQELVAGSPVGAELMRGDLAIAATGTVTLVDGDRVYAFGHPFLGAGRVEIPMISAEVVHTLADIAGSLKLTSPGREIGMFTEDRLSAIVGLIGARARMIPIDLSVSGEGYGEQSFHFEMVRHSRLSPLLAAAAVADALSSNLGLDQKSTMLAAGRVRVAGMPDLPLEMAFAGEGAPPAGLAIAVALQTRLVELWSNPFTFPEVEGLELVVEVTPEVHRYRLDAMHYDRGPLQAGQTLEVQCLLRKYRGDTRTETLRLQVPPGLADGTALTLAVGSPAQIDRALGRQINARMQSARDLGSTLKALGEIRSAHRLTAVLFSKGGAVVSRGAAFEQLPPTAEHLLATRSAAGGRSRKAVSSLARTEVELDGPVEGGLAVKLLVDSDLEAEKKE
jgi:hypothetical protein